MERGVEWDVRGKGEGQKGLWEGAEDSQHEADVEGSLHPFAKGYHPK